ncbi:uncharacterized protein TNCV_3878921 [Trichonephila clavipes]|nr:uncharacterized protein TNCV_3878921 [Trichonephila clavipes]
MKIVSVLLLFLIPEISRARSGPCVHVSSNIIGNSNLEIQGIKIKWRDKYLNIHNMYQPPDLNKIHIHLQNLFLPSTIYLDDLNAKHFMWGSPELERVPLLGGRTERSHGHGHEMTLVEPWGRPNDRLDDPKYHPYFDESTETNVTFQVSKTAYLHCSIRQLGDRMVS